jgi:vacuolar ATPase assembly integral membrane protein VMA21
MCRDGHKLTTSRLVIYKLLGFTLAMVVAPIGTYYMTVNMLFKGLSDVGVKGHELTEPGNATYAGGLAAIIANVVLVAYVIVAWNEDLDERSEAEKKAQ